MGNTSPTLTTETQPCKIDWTWDLNGEEAEIRIRKLTPKECWRLMDLSGENDENFLKAEAVCSNTQLYKQAGNSIVVSVIEAIFGQMIRRMND